MTKIKKAKYKHTPTPKKKPIIIKNPADYQNQFIAWHFCSMDSHGKWACDFNTIESIIKTLRRYETATWAEIEKASHNHPTSYEDICQAAKDRLEKIGFSHTATLYQLKITGKERLWGQRIQNVFQILWWDPDHTVYQSRHKY